MQELVPFVLFIALFVVLIVAALLTLIGSWLVIWRYQRGVDAAMNESGIDTSSGAAPVGMTPAVESSSDLPSTRDPLPSAPTARADALFERALRAPREAALGSLAAGLAYALILAAAYLVVTPAARTPLRFLFTVWVDCWPIVVAVAFTAPSFVRGAAIGAIAYFTPFVIGMLVAMGLPEAAPQSADAAVMETWETMVAQHLLRFWLVYAALPTVMLLLFLNPRTRAVSPLLLAFTTIVASGCMVAWLAIFSEPGVELVVQVVELTQWSLGWLLAGTLVLSIVACAPSLAGARLASQGVSRQGDQRSLARARRVLAFLRRLLRGNVRRARTVRAPRGVLAFAAYKLVLVGQRRLAAGVCRRSRRAALPSCASSRSAPRATPCSRRSPSTGGGSAACS